MNKREIKKLSKAFQATGYSLDEIACIFISMYKQGVVSFEERVTVFVFAHYPAESIYQ